MRPRRAIGSEEAPLNDSLFLAINAGAHPPASIIDGARLAATWLVPAVIVLFIVLWIRNPDPRRSALVSATAVMVLGLIANTLIGAVYFHPRPFMIGLGHQYLAHRPDGSFPSDHATFLWCLGFSLFALGTLRAWAALVVAAGVAVAWARVYLGVHFPFDMAGSLAVSLVLCSLAPAIERRIAQKLLPFGVGVYEWTLDVAHLPPALFPREPRPRSPSGRGRAS